MGWIPDEVPGIENAKINNFLIVESLLKSADIGQKLNQLTQITL